MVNLIKSFMRIFFQIFILFCVVASIFFSTKSHAKPLTREQISAIAKSIAKETNQNSKKMLGDGLVSVYAEAVGISVIIYYITELDFRLTPAELDEFLQKSRQMVLPKACQANKNNPAFNDGLYFILKYESTLRQELGEIKIDKAACR